jgi:hypothetical protein
VSLLVVKLIRTVSLVVCLIAILSFLLFALNQTSTASGQQQEELSGTKSAQTKSSDSGFRHTIDGVAEEVSSPVDDVSSSQWVERTLRLLFVLLVFGFALGFLARTLRVRA